MNDEALQLSKQILRDPVNILLKKEDVPLKGIAQFYVAVDENQKLAVIEDLYESLTITQSFIYCNSKRRVDWSHPKPSHYHFLSL